GGQERELGAGAFLRRELGRARDGVTGAGEIAVLERDARRDAIRLAEVLAIARRFAVADRGVDLALGVHRISADERDARRHHAEVRRARGWHPRTEDATPERARARRV